MTSSFSLRFSITLSLSLCFLSPPHPTPFSLFLTIRGRTFINRSKKKEVSWWRRAGQCSWTLYKTSSIFAGDGHSTVCASQQLPSWQTLGSVWLSAALRHVTSSSEEVLRTSGLAHLNSKRCSSAFGTLARGHRHSQNVTRTLLNGLFPLKGRPKYVQYTTVEWRVLCLYIHMCAPTLRVCVLQMESLTVITHKRRSTNTHRHAPARALLNFP